jgi:hypothetical protein
VALALVGTAATGCGTPPPKPDVDALVAQLDRARADSQMAAAAATIAPPPMATALNTVAAERTAHARALTDEITRMSGDTPTTSASPQATPSTPTTTSGGPIKPPSAQDVIAALKASSDSAAQTAAQRSGYQAGLLGSIAASCAAASAIGLDVRQAP